MQLTKDFTTENFTHSNYATRFAISNQLPNSVMPDVVRLHETILQPLRDATGHTISISRGYVCALLNRRTGGFEDSAHLTGRVADINCFPYGSVQELASLAVSLALPFDELKIVENEWIHIGVSPVERKPLSNITVVQYTFNKELGKRQCREFKINAGEILTKH